MNFKRLLPLALLLVPLIGLGTFAVVEAKKNKFVSIESVRRNNVKLIKTGLRSNVITIAGSKSLVKVNKDLANTLSKAGINIETKVGGSYLGIKLLKTGKADIAASAIRLDEAGYESVPIATDYIAFFSGGGVTEISSKGLKTAIESGVVLNSWIGDPSRRLIENVLQMEIPKDAPRIDVDAVTGSTGIIQNLKGRIGYASYELIKDQKSIKIISVDGKLPEDADYPFRRQLYYIIREDAPKVIKTLVTSASKVDK